MGKPAKWLFKATNVGLTLIKLIWQAKQNKQLAAIDKPGVMAGWLQQEPHDLIKQTENWVLGK